MSVIVKGMKEPETCLKCPMQFGGWCYVAPPEIDERVAPTVDQAYEQKKPDWCPLVKVPTPHGRLIDAKQLIENFKDKDANGINLVLDGYAIDCIDSAPNIIEAEE